MTSRAEQLVQKMIDKKLIHDTVESREAQLVEILKFNDDCLASLERVVDKQPSFRKKVGD
jgi:hypothetical protein